MAEPKDNKDIFPPKGNLRNSTYRRLGSLNEPIGVSETRAMLSQINLKDLYKSMQPHRSYLKMLSLAKTKPLPQTPPPEPWLLNRRTISHTLEDLEKHDAIITFLDDNMELRNCIAGPNKQRKKMRDII